MANRTTDFNYKVALAQGLKSLQGGRLRQAEEQFRYLVQHFATLDGGYRGLAKVFVEQEDRPAALKVLLDGGAKLVKSGERGLAIALYREAATLDPHDFTAHRRLAAALTLAGSTEDAAHEYVRYIKSALDGRDTERAKMEAQFALERLPGNAEIAEAARVAGAEVAAQPAAEPAPLDTPTEDERAALMRSAFASATPEPAETFPAQDWETRAAPSDASQTSAPANDPWQAPAPAPAPDAWQAPAPSASDWDAEPAAAPPMPEPEPIAADVDASTVEASAARYLAKGDPRGGQHALEAARRYIADGRMDAASDLLLQLISSGIAEHEAQRLLVEVARSLGKKDVAKAKVKLLVEALRLDGRAELAAEVEQLAQAF